MKQKLSILIGGLLAFALPLQTHAQNSISNEGGTVAGQDISKGDLNGTDNAVSSSRTDGRGSFGPNVKSSPINEVEIKNLQGEALGRIRGLAVDLPHGRIVEVLVVSDQFLGMGGRTVAVPPEVLMSDGKNEVYQIDISAEKFKAAPAFDLDKWAQSTSTDSAAAAYAYFGQAPTFLITGEAPCRKTIYGAPVTNLGVLEKLSHLINLPVDNLQGLRLGTVASLNMDVPKGIIITALIRSPESRISNMAKLATSATVIPVTLLSFNSARDGLLLDLSQQAYNAAPNAVFNDGVNAIPVQYHEQVSATPASNPGPALVQGSSASDQSTTAQIYQSIKNSNLDTGSAVQVATLEGHVTLRGVVNNQASKDGIGAIAIATVSVNNVDNQIVVARQLQASM
jgi:sporulation protein YlmC with PRC-barrel domain